MLLQNFSSRAIVAAALFLVAPAIADSLPEGQASSAAQQATQPPTADQQETAKKTLPPGVGRDELIQDCSGCHLLTVVSSQHKSESDWTDIVVDMRNRGATGSDEDMEKVVEYLAKNFGANDPATKVDVNTASISEIAAGLELPDDQARAIVDYRGKKGQFKDIDTLKKVPGVDAAKIDKVKEQIEF